jgi:hypothetical protein
MSCLGSRVAFATDEHPRERVVRVRRPSVGSTHGWLVDPPSAVPEISLRWAGLRK